MKKRVSTAIDLVLRGLDDDKPGLLGRQRDRLQKSAGTRDQRVKAGRIAMLHDLAYRFQWPTLRAIRDGKITVARAYQAYREGPAAVEALLRRFDALLLWPLCQQYVHEHRELKEAQQRLRRFKAFCEWAGGLEHTTVSMFTTDAVATFLANVDAYDIGTKGRKVASASTVNGYRVALSVLATWLLERGYLDRHPIAHKLVRPRTLPPARMPEPFTPTDYVAYRETALGYCFDAGLLLLLALHTGADRDELRTKLQVRDIRFGAPGTATKLRLQRPKWKKARERFVPIPDEIAALLRGHLALTGAKGEAPVFGAVTVSYVNSTHNRARRAIDRPSLRVKDLRHIAAIRWVQGNVNIQKVQYYLGHSTLDQTAVYVAYASTAHDDEQVMKAAAQWLEKSDVRRLVTTTTATEWDHGQRADVHG